MSNLVSNIGWICPRCNTVWSPLRDRCFKCDSAEPLDPIIRPGEPPLPKYPGAPLPTPDRRPPWEKYPPDERDARFPPAGFPHHMTTFQDSGARAEFGTGAVRDIDENKGRFDLLPADAVRQLARVMETGCLKYGDRNWESGIPLRRYIDSALRHLFCVLSGKTDEPHLPQAMWNIACAIQTEIWIRENKLPGCLRHEFPFPIRLLETGDVTELATVPETLAVPPVVPVVPVDIPSTNCPQCNRVVGDAPWVLCACGHAVCLDKKRWVIERIECPD